MRRVRNADAHVQPLLRMVVVECMHGRRRVYGRHELERRLPGRVPDAHLFVVVHPPDDVQRMQLHGVVALRLFVSVGLPRVGAAL